MKITRIIIITGEGSDRVSLETDLPEATYPYKESLFLSFHAAADSGEKYCKKHFPNIPIVVRNIRNKSNYKFSKTKR